MDLQIEGKIALMTGASLGIGFATPDEVASLVTYLCSPFAAATTGSAIHVGGGVIRSIG